MQEDIEQLSFPVTVGKNSVVVISPNWDRLESESIIGLDCSIYLNILGKEEMDEDTEQATEALLEEASAFFEKALEDFANYVLSTQKPE
jgi:hypothetical protein